jgi:2-hydroxychromene-2-carboxylate isomerase
MADDLPNKPVVDAYLGLRSRYSYLASTQLDRIATDAGVTFNWIPVVSADLFKPGRNPFEGSPISPQYEARYRETDARAWAEYYVVPFREPTGRLSFDPALMVRAALAAGEARSELMKRMFQAVFADERTRIDLADVAASPRWSGSTASSSARHWPTPRSRPSGSSSPSRPRRAACSACRISSSATARSSATIASRCCITTW